MAYNLINSISCVNGTWKHVHAHNHANLRIDYIMEAGHVTFDSFKALI